MAQEIASVPATAAVGLTVLAVEPVKSGKLFALATVEIDLDGVAIVVHGIQAVRCDPAGTRIELPKFRDQSGTWRSAVTLPEEIRAPLGDAVLEALIERGLAKRRFG
jgi:stage V sporulation protein G